MAWKKQLTCRTHLLIERRYTRSIRPCSGVSMTVANWPGGRNDKGNANEEAARTSPASTLIERRYIRLRLNPKANSLCPSAILLFMRSPMRNKLLLSLLLGFGYVTAWAEPEPAPPAFERSDGRTAEESGILEGSDVFDPDLELPKGVQVQVEFVELSHETLTKLLFLRSPKSADATDLRKQVQDLVSKKEAKVLETQIVVGKSGGKATTESIHEFNYPTEYTPPKLQQAPNDSNDKSAAPTPANSFPVTPGDPTAFGTRNVGGTLEVEPTIGADNRTIDLRFVPEFIWHTGNTVWHEGKDANGNPFKIAMPDFYCIRMNTIITCITGQYNFVGALSPKNDKGELDTSRKLMVFVKCDVMTVK
jgi:hypothetical protein